MPLSTDSYEDADGNVWAFDPPYDDDPIDDDTFFYDGPYWGEE